MKTKRYPNANCSGDNLNHSQSSEGHRDRITKKKMTMR